MVLEGIGLHTGEPARLIIHPSDKGILTVRLGAQRVPVRWDYVVDTHRATVIGMGGQRLATVEHLLSAMWALRVGSAVIEVVQGREVPAMDGSALPFLEAIGAAGVVACPNAFCKPIHTMLTVQEGERVVSIQPGEETVFGYIQFSEPLGVQAGSFVLADYAQAIAPARTFAFLHEVEALRRQGLAQGGSLEN
ncbi:MAG: UDP-3-O-[3-hydroxymyristoyl] N-acetylglucosamine deacetylase, partial [Armatimonadota bacterium]